MATLYDKDGNEVEAFTQEEVDAKAAEEKAAAEEKQKEDDKAAEEKAAQEKIDADAKAEADKKGEPTEIEALTSTVKDLQTSLQTSQKREALGKFSMKDEEVRKSVENKFDQLANAGYEQTPEGIEQRAKDAYTIITGGAPEASVDVASFAGGPAKDGQHASNGGEVTDKDKAIRSTLGITDEMAEKFKPTKK